MCLLPKINFYSWQNVVTEFVPWLTLISLNLTLIPPYCSQKGYRTRRYLCEHTLANIHKVISTTSDPNHHGRGYTTGYTDFLPQCWHHKIVIPTNYKDRRSPSQYWSMQMTRKVFPIKFLTLVFCSFSSNILLSCRIENKHILMPTYTWKYPQSDTNNLLPSTPRSRIWSRQKIFV